MRLVRVAEKSRVDGDDDDDDYDDSHPISLGNPPSGKLTNGDVPLDEKGNPVEPKASISWWILFVGVSYNRNRLSESRLMLC
jgi:hypothetical protein